jgi:hypothetical protein
MLVRYFKPLLIISTLTGLGVWLLGYGWSQVEINQRLDQGSISIEGIVLDASTRELSKDGQSSTLTVEYAPEGGPLVTRTFDADRTTYQSALATGKAMVSYLPDEPEVSRVSRFAELPYQILIGLGAVMLLSGGICLWMFMIGRPS